MADSDERKCIIIGTEGLVTRVITIDPHPLAIFACSTTKQSSTPKVKHPRRPKTRVQKLQRR